MGQQSEPIVLLAIVKSIIIIKESLQHHTVTVVVKTSLSGFLVGREYDYQVLNLQHYSHKAMYTVCQSAV